MTFAEVPAAAMPHRRRTQARILALQALCQFDVIGDAFASQLDDFLADVSLRVESGIPPTLTGPTLSFARELAVATRQARERYDELLGQAVTGWSVRRMAPVDRNILRLGLHELLSDAETPPQVVINEAIELARTFGDAESPKFVNGVLDGLRRTLGVVAPRDPRSGSS